MDITGGMNAGIDEVAGVPLTADFMEGVNVWLWDEEGRIGLPRLAVDAMGAQWDTAHLVSLNAALPGGRVLFVRSLSPPQPAADELGRPRIRGAGPLRFECLEPFRRWRVIFDGLTSETTAGDQITQRLGDKQAKSQLTVPLKFDLDLVMSDVPSVNGIYEPDGATLATEHRFEQLCRAEGRVEVDGTTIPFRGGGLRIHRRGRMQRSDYSDWMGHVWMSAQFPSGRAFGIDEFHPRPDGSIRYHEGWLRDDEGILPAKFVEAPWKTEWRTDGEDVGFTLRTTRADARIEGETYLTTVNPESRSTDDRAPFPAVQQGIARFRWGSEEAYGMIERSSPREG